MIAIYVAAHAVSSYNIGAERRMESNKATHSVNDNRHSDDSKSDDDNEETVYVITFGGKEENGEKERDTEEIGKKRESFLFVHERVWSYNKQYRAHSHYRESSRTSCCNQRTRLCIIRWYFSVYFIDMFFFSCLYIFYTLISSFIKVSKSGIGLYRIFNISLNIYISIIIYCCCFISSLYHTILLISFANIFLWR